MQTEDTFYVMHKFRYASVWRVDYALNHTAVMPWYKSYSSLEYILAYIIHFRGCIFSLNILSFFRLNVFFGFLLQQNRDLDMFINASKNFNLNITWATSFAGMKPRHVLNIYFKHMINVLCVQLKISSFL